MENDEDDLMSVYKVMVLAFTIIGLVAAMVLVLIVIWWGIERAFNLQTPREFRTEVTQSSMVYAWEAPRIHSQTLGCIINKPDLNERIPACESGGDPKVCNREYGCSGGMGLWGFVPKTWNETIDRMVEAEAYLPDKCIEKFSLPASEEKIEAVFDPVCNDLAGRWLLKTDGTGHWGTATTWWGSYHCWNK